MRTGILVVIHTVPLDAFLKLHCGWRSNFFLFYFIFFVLNVHRISKMKRPILNIISRRKGYTSFSPVLIPIYVAKKRGSHVCCSWYRAHTNVELNIHYGLLRVLSYASGRRRVHIYCALYILLFSSLSFQTIRKIKESKPDPCRRKMGRLMLPLSPDETWRWKRRRPKTKKVRDVECQDAIDGSKWLGFYSRPITSLSLSLSLWEGFFLDSMWPLGEGGYSRLYKSLLDSMMSITWQVRVGDEDPSSHITLPPPLLLLPPLGKNPAELTSCCVYTHTLLLSNKSNHPFALVKQQKASTFGWL